MSTGFAVTLGGMTASTTGSAATGSAAPDPVSATISGSTSRVSRCPRPGAKSAAKGLMNGASVVAASSASEPISATMKAGVNVATTAKK